MRVIEGHRTALENALVGALFHPDLSPKVDELLRQLEPKGVLTLVSQQRGLSPSLPAVPRPATEDQA